MNLLSKKALTGLMIGAMSLSIWTPVSEAAAPDKNQSKESAIRSLESAIKLGAWISANTAQNPEKNQYYSIKLQADQNLVWDIRNSETGFIDVLLEKSHNGDNQKFLFFPLDGGKYAIVNKNSGKPISVGAFTPEGLSQKDWTGDSTQQWYLRKHGLNSFEIVNQGYGKVASYGRFDIAGWDLVDLDNSNTSDPNRLFKIQATENPFSLPKLPSLGTRPSAPNYTGSIDQQLPQTSNSVVVGASLVPSIMVKDNQRSDYTKIHNSPYYVLTKEEYWDKTFSAVIPSGITRQYTFKTGMTSTDQQKMTETLSMKIGVDLGLKFGETTAAIKTEISKTLQTEISTTNTEVSEETIASTVTSEPGKTTGFTEYQLATKYTLYRADGSKVSNPWIVKNNKETIARKNSQ